MPRLYRLSPDRSSLVIGSTCGQHGAIKLLIKLNDMKIIALNGLNQPVDNSAKRTREAWLNWSIKAHAMAAGERVAGMIHTVSQHYTPERGDYFRLHLCGQLATK
jgi:hypothetical protein